MGTWGTHSDENDQVYDAFGAGIEHRFAGANSSKKISPEAQKEFDALIDELPDDYTGSHTDDVLPGVVRLGMLRGFKVSVEKLKKAKEMLAAELHDIKDNSAGWDDPHERTASIGKELQAIDHAIKNGGVGSRGPARGVMHMLAARKPSKTKKK